MFRFSVISDFNHGCAYRCVLNKADQVDRQRLMRVYGALMWSLGKVIKTPEVLRVYIGTFWDQPLLYDDNATLFEMEEKDLMKDLKDLPRNRFERLYISLFTILFSFYVASTISVVRFEKSMNWLSVSEYARFMPI